MYSTSKVSEEAIKEAEKHFDLLLKGNAEFSTQMKARNGADYFPNMSKGQSPLFFVIGCSDSRVGIETITQSAPGSVFVVRNIANQVKMDDLSSMAALQYAVEHLKVENVIVLGHTHCGGCKAAMDTTSLGFLDHYLSEIKNTIHENQKEISEIKDQAKKVDRVIELNVLKGCLNVSKTSFVQKAWSQNKALFIRGAIYDIATGKIRNLNVDNTLLQNAGSFKLTF